MMKKFLLLSPKNRTVYNFRGELIKSIKNKGYDVLVTGPDKTDVNRIEELGARFIEIPMNKTGTSIKNDLKYCKSLIRLMKREHPDVTLGYTVKPVVYGSIAAKLSGVKNINSMITGGGYTFTATTTKAKVLGVIVRNLYRIGLGVADTVIFQNPDDRNEFIGRKLVKRIKTDIVNGSGVNMEHFRHEPLPEGSITFLMLSRLLKSKGVGEYLEAARIVKSRHPEVQFKLLGKYEYSMQDALSAEYVERFISDGVVERYEESDDVRPYYKECSVYVLPSYREGTPRTVLEAMSVGRPIITTDTNGCRETVLDGVNGYLVPVHNVPALVEAIERFIANPQLIEKMGTESIRICKEKFEVNAVNKKMLEIMNIQDRVE